MWSRSVADRWGWRARIRLMYGLAEGRHGVCAAPERSLCEPKAEVIFDGPVRTSAERLLTLPSGLDNGASLFTADGTQSRDESSPRRAVQPHPTTTTGTTIYPAIHLTRPCPATTRGTTATHSRHNPRSTTGHRTL